MKNRILYAFLCIFVSFSIIATDTNYTQKASIEIKKYAKKAAQFVQTNSKRMLYISTGCATLLCPIFFWKYGFFKTNDTVSKTTIADQTTSEQVEYQIQIEEKSLKNTQQNPSLSYFAPTKNDRYTHNCYSGCTAKDIKNLAQQYAEDVKIKAHKYASLTAIQIYNWLENAIRHTEPVDSCTDQFSDSALIDPKLNDNDREKIKAVCKTVSKSIYAQISDMVKFIKETPWKKHARDFIESSGYEKRGWVKALQTRKNS